jgi:orotate phosphoribosyltransferase
MAALTTSIPPVVVQDPDARRDDLAADLRALADRSGSLDAFMALSRPSILRRLARLVAERLPVGIDRLVGSHGRDDILVGAVALHTGIPFAVLDDSSGDVLGELHASENVAVVSAGGTDDAPLARERLEELRVHTATTVTVFGGAGASAADGTVLFTLAELSAAATEGAAA